MTNFAIIFLFIICIVFVYKNTGRKKKKNMASMHSLIKVNKSVC